MILRKAFAMDESPATRPSLLVRIRDRKDEDAWRQFVALYTPLVYRFARRRGLQDADAADLAQDVLRAVAVAASHLEYDPQRGSFRGWLFGVARHKLSDFLAKQERQCQGSGDTSAQIRLMEHPAPAAEAALWDQEYERRLFEWAAEQVRGGFTDQTWQAFWQTAVEGREAKETAAALGMTLGAVYIAKSRVLARLRKQIERCQEM
jgi:RNA polymerase sigma-70 factor (ECF subfamily)